MKLHNLKDQNLLRHNEIQKQLGSRGYLISDSITLLNLIYIYFFKRELFFVHALELYSVSFGACRSEYKYRWEIVSDNRIQLYKSYVGYLIALIRVYLLRKLSSNSNLLFISSVKRKKYLIAEGVDFSVMVLRNKPVVNNYLSNYSKNRDNSIILIGNMYSTKHDFIKVAKYALLHNMYIHCYGVSSEDLAWLKSLNYSNIQIYERVSQEVVSQILFNSRFALCLYSNLSVNNKYSSSSKVFELLYHGVIPIVSNNAGLLYELTSLNANYKLIDNLNTYEEFNNNNNNNKLMFSEVCQFSYEIKSLSTFLKTFKYN